MTLVKTYSQNSWRRNTIMIISRTPLRVSFVGGGSDLPPFYKNYKGAVVSTAIDKYMYITVNKKFDNKIRASYSITEIVNKIGQLKHELIRETLKMLNLDGGIEITSISDIPSQGTGLGSSSSYTVGLLNALHAFKGEYASAETLAKEACHIEIECCQKPIGKQDQYATAFGNLNYIQFNPDESVFVNPIICRKETKENLQKNLLMFYTGLTRSSSTILKEQSKNIKENKGKSEIMKKMALLAKQLKEALENNRLDDFGELLHQNWMLKKQIASGISQPKIDGWYEIARRNGALGGKILGAGGGGFLLLYAPYENHQTIYQALSELKPIPFKFEPEGSKIIYFGER